MAKRITAIISLTIIGLLIVATIIMANVKVNYNIKCNKPDVIRVQYSSFSANPVNGDAKDKIVEYINNSSKESSLTALFNGTLFNHAEIVTDNSTPKDLSKYPPTNAFYVQYVYNQPQTLKAGNKDYTDGNGDKYYYKELWFTVSNTNGTEQVNVYVVPWFSTTGGVNTADVYSRRYVLSANFSSLYNYLVENGFNA